VSSNIEHPQAGQTSHASGGAGLQTVLVWFASARLAVAVGSLIVFVCILGTVLPQGGDVEKFVSAHPGAAGMMQLLGRIGFTSIFEASWFAVLLVFFALNISACIVRRLSANLKSGRMGISGWGFLLTHISMLLILAGAVVRGVVGQRGTLVIQEGQTVSRFATSRGPADLPFDVNLVKFDIEYYEGEASVNPHTVGVDMLSVDCADLHILTQIVFKVGVPVTVSQKGNKPDSSNDLQIVVSRYVPDFVVDTSTHEVSSRSDDPENPAILVNVDGAGLHVSKWLFANHPDFDMSHAASGGASQDRLMMRYRAAAASPGKMQSGHIRSFKSALHLLENGKAVKEKTIEVNSPLRYRGYTFYQSGYNPSDLTWSTLEVVKDPGVAIVYTGFIFMIGGLILLLCFKPVARLPSQNV